jgi:uncharacterized protein (DUF1778 family)
MIVDLFCQCGYTVPTGGKIMAIKERETEKINIRIDPSVKSVIDEAAELSNTTRTNFMVDAAYHAAQEVLLDQRLFLLDSEQWNAFNAKLNEPPKRNEKLAQLMQKKAPWE